MTACHRIITNKATTTEEVLLNLTIETVSHPLNSSTETTQTVITLVASRTSRVTNLTAHIGSQVMPVFTTGAIGIQKITRKTERST